MWNRWKRAFLDFGPTPSHETYVDVLRRYAEPHRFYHTSRHIAECLALFEVYERQCRRPSAVLTAIIYHDAVYDPRRSDNEEKSAELADAVVLRCGAKPADRDEVRRLILATKHDGIPETGDERLLVDIDLSILGAPEARFDDYEKDIRREYAFVDPETYRAARRAILERFLARPTIYATEDLRARFEDAARKNLARSIAALSHR